MTSGALRLSNYNYNAEQFLDRVRALIARDGYFLGPAVQRSALLRLPSGELQHAITKIDVLPEGTLPPNSEVWDYGTFLFIREIHTKEALLSRLATLVDKAFAAGPHALVSQGVGFSDRYEASRNSYSDWPCTVFHVSFGSAQLPFEPLLHAALRSFGSPFEAIREFLDFKQFHDSSDARLGHILLCVPNLNSRLEALKLIGHRLEVTTSGRTVPTAFKLDVNYKSLRETSTVEKSLTQHHTAIELSFIPSELRLWLIAKEGYLADFHEENEYYSTGANPVLLKRRPADAGFELVEESEIFSAPENGVLATDRVFVIHGHNSAIKETIARFLEKLGLEAVILHEQPNKGATIIEKFHANSKVGFAVALLTGDDEARETGTKNKLAKRARQNVMFEFGYFIGTLGRTRVCALVEAGVEIPSDYQGVVFIQIDPSGHWRFDLVRELKAAGLDVDANRAL